MNHFQQDNIEFAEINKAEIEQHQKPNKTRLKKPLILLLPIGILFFLFTPPGGNLLNNISSLRANQEKESNTIYANVHEQNNDSVVAI